MFIENEIIINLKSKRNSLAYRIGLYLGLFHEFVQKYKLISDIFLIRKRRLLTVGITITEKCNLSCLYCYQKFKTNKSISPKKALQIITHILKSKSIWTDVEFRLLGGEPFIESQLLRDIIDLTLSKQWERKYIFKITTNGTLLDKEIKEWLEEKRKNVILVLSLDGPQDIHNRNRSFSYQKIDFNFFKDNWPDQPIKMTVNKDSMSNLYNSVVQIMNLGFNISFSLAGGVKWGEDDLIIFKRELKKIESIFSKCNVKIPPVFNINFSRILNSNDSTRQCGIGKNVIAYDTEGLPYPCQMFLPNTSINLDHIPDIDIFSNDKILIDKGCNECPIKSICPTCYAYNYIERGKCNERDRSLCGFFKELIKSSAIIKANRILNTKNYYFKRRTIAEIDAILQLNTLI